MRGIFFRKSEEEEVSGTAHLAQMKRERGEGERSKAIQELR